jgi:hypothetical protein
VLEVRLWGSQDGFWEPIHRRYAHWWNTEEWTGQHVDTTGTLLCHA